MRRLLPAGLLLALLPACTITPPKNAKPTAENVALTCGALPVTENLWGESYQNMANSKVDPDWGQPFYEGFGTAARVLATPFYLIADVLVAPLRLGQPCVPAAAATPAPASAPAKPAARTPTATPAGTRPSSYRRSAIPPPPASGTSSSPYRTRPRPAPPPAAAEPEEEP